ncbi:MAG: hypothetical protein ACYSTL_06765, partial [Planctomycetota bacterium]
MNGQVRIGSTGQRAAMTTAVLLTITCALHRTAPGKDAPKQLQAYPTKYYVIHSDLDVETVKEAAARVTAMAEEYHRRTRGFAGTIRKRLPFYLFSEQADYHAAGAPPGSAGMYDRKKLMAVAPKDRSRRFWKLIQHEGFHQFAESVISRSLPMWVNEGMAEYFGEGIWTGDNYVTGVIPPERLRRVKKMIESSQLRPFSDMIAMTHAEWNAA